MTLLPSPCTVLRVRGPTTGSTGPRVGVASSRAQSKTFFAWPWVVPLPVSLSTPQCCLDVWLCQLCAMSWLLRSAQRPLSYYEIIKFQKTFVSEQNFRIGTSHSVRQNPARGTRGTRGSQQRCKDKRQEHTLQPRVRHGPTRGDPWNAATSGAKDSSIPVAPVVPSARGTQRPPAAGQRLKRGMPTPTARPRWVCVCTGGKVIRPDDLADTP